MYFFITLLLFGCRGLVCRFKAFQFFFYLLGDIFGLLQAFFNGFYFRSHFYGLIIGEACIG